MTGLWENEGTDKEWEGEDNIDNFCRKHDKKNWAKMLWL